jgi:GNAT superfamily N-acetyltransferase
VSDATQTRIEPARPVDVPLLLELIRELAVFEKLAHEAQASAEELGRHLFGPQPRAEAVIAFHAAEPAGFALYFHNFSTFLGKPGLYLEDLYVRPAYRGRGIGEGLLRHLARLALERGCGRFEWSVLDWNLAAIDFYRRLGAVPMDEWTVYRVTGPALAALAGGKLPDHG